MDSGVNKDIRKPAGSISGKSVSLTAFGVAVGCGVGVGDGTGVGVGTVSGVAVGAGAGV